MSIFVPLLQHNMEERYITLGEFIIKNQNDFQYTSGELSRLMNSIRLAAKIVATKNSAKTEIVLIVFFILIFLN